MKDRDYVAGSFFDVDILMHTTLRLLRHTDMVSRHPALDGLHRRCATRPAFERALTAQMALFALAETTA